jgi:hypothetical protein
MEMMPRTSAEYVWVEEVQGDVSSRSNNRLVRVDGEPPRPMNYPLYRSVFTSDERLGEYVRANKGPENPSGIRGYRGPCTALCVPFDIDRERRVDGKSEPDWPRAIEDARRLLESLRIDHDVDLSMVRCSLTGGRGIHIRVPAEMFGGFEPSEDVPDLVRQIALALAGGAQVSIDGAIYDRNRLLRVPNSRHQSGRWCVPVYTHELLNTGIDTLLQLMEKPRPDVTWVGELESKDSLVKQKRECERRIASETRRSGEFPEPPPERAKEIVAFLTQRNISHESKGSDYVIRCPINTHEDNHPSFRIDRRSGVYHCFGCGIRGNWRECRELLNKYFPAEATPDEYGTVAQVIYGVRQRKDNQDRRKDFEINREVTSTILVHLERVGRFYTDGCAAYFFFETDKHLIEINPEGEGFRLLLYRYGINPIESIYRWIAEELRNVALSKGERAEIHRLSHYDSRRFTVYFYGGNNRVYRISCDRIDLVDNGTDGVLFVSDPRCKAFERVPVPDGPSRFTEIITSKINFADDVLTAGERQRIFELWFYSTFFESIMPTKPIVAFIGPKGSGKSITLRKTGMLLFGERFDVTPLTNDSKDFDAAVTNSPFVAFDNADHKCAWLNDRLATVATGGVIKRRELYTTNRLVEIPSRCFVGITAHTPHFRRDDVADRLLIMKVERFEEFVAEKTLLAEVVARRNDILSEVIEKLQRIVRALRAEQGVDDSSAFRMADFADFAVKVARHEGWGEQLRRIFEKLGHEQSEFTLEGDPIYETLSVWAAENPGHEVTYKDLWAELKTVADHEGIDFHEYETNARAFVRRMPNIRSNLEEFFEITDIARGSRKVYHTFRLREGE